MNEKRPVTRQGFFSRVFSGDYRREGRRMIVGSFPIPSRSTISEAASEEDLLRDSLSIFIEFVYATRRERVANGDAIST